MPELRVQVLRGNEKMRCFTPGCGVWHDCYPSVTRDGETRVICSARCRECTQRRLDQGDPRMIERFDEALPVVEVAA